MYQKQVKHPVSKSLEPISKEVFGSMYQLFEQIGLFWKNLDDAAPYRSRLYTFIENRISLRPIYRDHYIMAKETIDELISEYGKQKLINCFLKIKRPTKSIQKHDL